MAAKGILDFLKMIRRKCTFLEIGFGQCYDFQHFFESYHRRGLITYSGMDITPQFVEFAREAFREHDFQVGGFLDLEPDVRWDVTYTRHTLEHQPPSQWEECLRRLLGATKILSVISWFVAPQTREIFKHHPHQGPGGTPAWVNQYQIDKVMGLIGGCGFRVQVLDSDKLNKVYLCRREDELLSRQPCEAVRQSGFEYRGSASLRAVPEKSYS